VGSPPSSARSQAPRGLARTFTVIRWLLEADGLWAIADIRAPSRQVNPSRRSSRAIGAVAQRGLKDATAVDPVRRRGRQAACNGGHWSGPAGAARSGSPPARPPSPRRQLHFLVQPFDLPTYSCRAAASESGRRKRARCHCQPTIPGRSRRGRLNTIGSVGSSGIQALAAGARDSEHTTTRDTKKARIPPTAGLRRVRP
jgi:hypothetical protein